MGRLRTASAVPAGARPPTGLGSGEPDAAG